MELQRELLPDIFNRTLTLDRQSSGKSDSRALTLFERMAKRLDEIAANTRRGGKSSVATATRSGQNNDRANHSSGSASARNTRQQERTSRASSVSGRATNSRQSQNSRAGTNQPTGRSTGPTKNQRPASSGAATGNRERDLSGRFVSKKSAQIQGANTSSRISGQANALAHERRSAKEQGKIISSAIVGGMGRLGSMIKSSMAAVTQNSDAKDAVGLALGGPFYSAIKEIKDAMPDSIKDKMEERKARKEENRKLVSAIKATNGRERDEKGRFKPDANEARRQIAQTEVLEDELLLEEREAKANAKRHKELVKAVKANKRDMLDRYLDRRMLGGGRGRDRVIRERSTTNRTANARDAGRDRTRRDAGRQNGRTSNARGENRSGGLLQRAGRIAGGVGNAAMGTLALGGKAVSGLLRALPGIGQALALGMAAYDGFQGWNDKELHKQAFGLKDGQEATTGQKASAAAASILDMGGLTSGLLGMLGIEFDKAGVAKSIYQLGCNIASVASAFIEQAGPLLTQVWTGISDFAGRIWSGAQEVGNSIANFATGVWDKGVQFATDIASWAGNAIQQGAGILTGIWQSASDSVTGIWGNLSDFATNALSKAGEMLSGLWEGITALPGKIMDGVKDLASSAIEGGSELLSKGKDWVADKASSALDGAKNLATSTWDAAKNLGGKIFSFFGPSEAKADELPTDPEERKKIIEQGKAIAASQAVAPKAVEQQSALLPENRPDPMPFNQQQTTQNAGEQISSDLIDSNNAALLNAINQSSYEQQQQNDADLELQENAVSTLSNVEKAIKDQTDTMRLAFGLDDSAIIAGKLNNFANALGNVSRSPTADVNAGTDMYSRQYGSALPNAGWKTQYVDLAKFGDRGSKNINPGNVKAASNSDYLGQVGRDDKQHAIFATKEAGVAGLVNRLYRYNKDKTNGDGLSGRKTITDIMSLYAPAHENNTQQYIKFISDRLGVGANEQIDFRKNPEMLKPFVQAIMKMESPGHKTYTDAQIDKGIEIGQDEVRYGKEEAGRKHAAYLAAGNGTKGTSQGANQLASQGVRLNADGKTVNLSTVKGIDSLRLQDGVNIDKMHPEAVSRMANAAADYEKLTGQKLEISEGYRDYAEQVRTKRKHGNNAATPGKSTHGMGNTFDVAKSKIEDVENRLRAAGVDPVKFFAEHGLTRTAYRPGASRQNDESWHFEAADLRTAEMQRDRDRLQSGKKTGAEYLTAEQKAKYMAPVVPQQLQANAQPSPIEQARAEAEAATKAFQSRGYDEEQTNNLLAFKRRVGSRELDLNDPEAFWGDNGKEAADKEAFYKMKEAREKLAKLEAEQAAVAAQQPKQPQPTAIAEQVRPEQPVQSVATAQQTPAQNPASIAAAQANVSMATPKREPIEPEAVRQIDPEREIKGNSNENGPLLKIMGQILAAIEAGNKKLGSLGKDSGDGPPSISTEYDNPAAQGMAMDSA